MGGWDETAKGGKGGKSKKPKGTPSLNTVRKSSYGLSTEFADDNPVRMPAPTDTALLAAARIRREMVARTGRDSTRLSPGTGAYRNTFLGSV